MEYATSAEGANRYAPENVEMRTVPMGDVSSTGMKDTLTDAERRRLAEGMKAEAAQTIVMPDAAATKEVRDALDAIDFDTPELSVDGGRFLEWAEKWRLDPSKKKNQREWAQRNAVHFDTDFDPEKFGRLVTGVGNLVDKLTKYGYNDFRSLATYIYEQDAAKYGRAKPVLQDIWNAVARARKLARVSDEQTEAIYAVIEKPKAQTGEVSSPETAAPEAPKPPPPQQAQGDAHFRRGGRNRRPHNEGRREVHAQGCDGHRGAPARRQGRKRRLRHEAGHGHHGTRHEPRVERALFHVRARQDRIRPRRQRGRSAGEDTGYSRHDRQSSHADHALRRAGQDAAVLHAANRGFRRCVGGEHYGQ